MKIIGVNGIHNWSKSNNSFTDKILARLSLEYDVVDVEYPRMLAILGWLPWSVNRRAKLVAEAITGPDDVIIAHSFGCLATLRAMQLYGARVRKVIFFAAAAEVDEPIPDNFQVLYNIHSSADLALKLGYVLPLHSFGKMGHSGALTDNPNVVNVDAAGHDHDDYVHPKNICDWVDVVRAMIQGTFDPSMVPTNKLPLPRSQPPVTLGRL